MNTGQKNKAVCLALFGFQNENSNCHSFNSFLQFFSVNLRAYNAIYPDWQIRLNIDEQTYNGFSKYFDYLSQNEIVSLAIKPNAPLCRAMLWRIEDVNNYDYIICRDIDSLPTFRERLCVDEWIESNTFAHAISDSVSHNIPLMGGMIGFKQNAFTLTEDDFLTWRKGDNMKFDRKGTDQDFLNEVILPKIPTLNVRKSIKEHRFLGYNQKASCVKSIEEKMNNHHIYSSLNKIADSLCNHIGQGGFHLEYCHNQIIDKTYLGAVNFYVRANAINQSFNLKVLEIESKYPETFYWTL